MLKTAWPRSTNWLSYLRWKDGVHVMTAVGGGLTGKTFVLTGTLPTMGHDEAGAGRSAGRQSLRLGVQKNVLRGGRRRQPSSKLAKAQELGITILDEAGLLALLDGFKSQEGSSDEAS
ncbi:hypothetical protein LP419_37170 [Massilia sp. H-1]|nr:hypothetical protein LP419_37170 [Massilia sp. H-1]